MNKRFKDNPLYYNNQNHLTEVLIHFIFFGIAIITKQLIFLEIEELYLFILYITTSSLIVGTFRIFFEFNSKSPIPYYTTTIPFVVLSLVFKQNKLIFETLYIISISFLIYLSDIKNKIIHLRIIIFILYIFFGTNVLLRYFFNDNMCQSNKFHIEMCDKKEELEKVDLLDEFFLLITTFFLIEVLSRFQYYIDYGKFINVRRENALRELFFINRKLRKNINTLNRYIHLSEDTLYSDVPKKELLNLFIKIKKAPKLNIRYKQYIRYFIKILNQNISLSKESLDSSDRVIKMEEIQKWLDMLKIQKHDKVVGMFTNKEVEDFSYNIINEFPEEVKDYLKKNILDLHYNSVELNRLSEGHSLFYTALWIVTIEYDLLNKLNIKKALFYEWVINIESGYKKNPYHNSMHAADVLFMTHYFVVKSGIVDKLTNEELFSIIVAAFIHDFKHPGVNNNFLIEISDELAILYNDQSVLENYHIASSFLLMDQFNILDGMKEEMRDYIREIIISMVLATDMFYNTFWTKKFSDKVNDKSLNLSNKEDKLLLFNIFIKCADIGNPVKPLDVYILWVKMVTEEFFKQGDEEAKRGMIISPYMDRNNENVPDNQIGFISFAVRPLYDSLNQYFNGAFDKLLQNIDQNLEYWKIKKQQRLQKEEEEQNKMISHKHKVFKTMEEKRLSHLEEEEYNIDDYQSYQSDLSIHHHRNKDIPNETERKMLGVGNDDKSSIEIKAKNIHNNSYNDNQENYVDIKINNENSEYPYYNTLENYKIKNSHHSHHHYKSKLSSKSRSRSRSRSRPRKHSHSQLYSKSHSGSHSNNKQKLKNSDKRNRKTLKMNEEINRTEIIICKSGNNQLPKKKKRKERIYDHSGSSSNTSLLKINDKFKSSNIKISVKGSNFIIENTKPIRESGQLRIVPDNNVNNKNTPKSKKEENVIKVLKEIEMKKANKI
ncbi:HD-domain/PDEase-like protein [Neocallimastix californiae]|uniref:Phosphodiesterase n=1 Tax=Neocallimastix californiae TaxID=1754190 RepID=A0A1Y2AX04_9FUNG|nr:HD-domain/PDEase-like protein [Neocallimastix californiae]|eukprot:ORY27026.1 HD-domain/PDEase-like protein [Neocallimastix californiae]